MRIVVIVPTYNEAGNIERLLDALHGQRARVTHELQLLVVDDNSPDGTALLVEAAARRLPGIHLIRGDRQGLGAAYIRGMTHALRELAAEAVVEMDADFSHDPADLPRLFAALEAGGDFIVGSRYVRGGSIPASWGLHRRLNSRFGNIVARHLAGIRGVRDCTAGYRVIRATVLRAIALDRLRVQGYAFQIALLHAAQSGGARVVELPVHFADRERGESKLGFGDILEFFRSAAWIRLQSSATFLRFALVGISGVAVNLGAFSLLMKFGLNKFIASPIAIQCSILWNFLGNSYWTFRHRQLGSGAGIRGLKFNAVSFLALAVSYGVFVLLAHLQPAGSPLLHQLIGIAPAMLVNYFLNSYWTFRPARGPA